MEENSTNPIETWVTLKEYPNYEINTIGQVRNSATGIIYSIQHRVTRGDARGFLILIDREGKREVVYVEELVADTFLNKPENGYTLIHVDGDIDNCSVDNLVYVDDETLYEQEYYKKTGIHKPKEYFHFYPLIDYPDSQYEINKMGQIRNKKSHRIINGALHDGYRAHTLRIDNKVMFCSAHILVAKQFIPNPENKPYVNHIDENRANPCIDNLEWVTASENIRHGTAMDRSNQGRNKLVNEYNIHGRYLRTWKSATILANFFNKLYPEINNKETIRSILNYNSKDSLNKKSFANRVFIYYNGNCDDIDFQANERKLKYYKSVPTLDGIDVPGEYLANDIPNSIDNLTILQSMLKSPIGFGKAQKIALKYAIECVKKVKANELIMNKIVEMIHDYKSTKP